jgi:hypothetical protein
MPRVSVSLAAWLAGALTWFTLAVGGASAHPGVAYNLRAIHFVHTPDGLTAYYRLSMPLVVGNKIGAQRADGSYLPAPYTTSGVQDGAPLFEVDIEAIRRDPLGLARLVASGHELRQRGALIEAEIRRARVHPAGHVPPFQELSLARQAVVGPPYPAAAPVVDSGYAVVDVELFYPARGGIRAFSLRSDLAPGVMGERETMNMIIDHQQDGSIQRYSEFGDLSRPLRINANAFEAVLEFVRGGIVHMAAGADHLLFVLCLVLAANSLGRLVWAVSGFTAGHTITLIAGFYGYAPSAAWFIPAVEWAIALSIAYAALTAIRRRPFNWTSFSVVAGIGLLHGLGFSFGLRATLQEDSPYLVSSLLSFNAGVEVGQLCVALTAWLFLLGVRRLSDRIDRNTRLVLASLAALVGAYWSIERGLALLPLFR